MIIMIILEQNMFSSERILWEETVEEDLLIWAENRMMHWALLLPFTSGRIHLRTDMLLCSTGSQANSDRGCSDAFSIHCSLWVSFFSKSHWFRHACLVYELPLIISVTYWSQYCFLFFSSVPKLRTHPKLFFWSDFHCTGFFHLK